jgi:hypothetical protein
MSDDSKHIPVRCEPDDPRRCQANVSHGQCPFLAVPPNQNGQGGKYCPIHTSSFSQNDKGVHGGLYNFNRTEVLSRLQTFKNHPDSRALAIELGLLRLILEQTVNKCDAYDLLGQSAQISVMVDKIRDTLIANVKLEQKVGDLLSIEQVITIAQALYGVVCEHINDVEILERIANEFENVLARRGQ